MLRLNNFARIMFISFQFLFIVFGVLMAVLAFVMMEHPSFYMVLSTFVSVALPPVFYYIFFMLPKVKEQFKTAGG